MSMIGAMGVSGPIGRPGAIGPPGGSDDLLTAFEIGWNDALKGVANTWTDNPFAKPGKAFGPARDWVHGGVAYQKALAYYEAVESKK